MFTEDLGIPVGMAQKDSDEPKTCPSQRARDAFSLHGHLLLENLDVASRAGRRCDRWTCLPFSVGFIFRLPALLRARVDNSSPSIAVISVCSKSHFSHVIQS